ncbi:MAG TPA: phage holin family protein [Frankiaceae bacterium]|nr:phage holin family protein [Frankiaceae bacterium]
MAEPQRPASTQEASTGELFGRLSQQMSTLVRDEIRLAQLDLTEKGKRAGLGAGAFGGAAAFGYLALATLIAAAVLGLAEAVPAWLSALIVGLVLLVVTGVLALFGKKKVRSATPPMPTEAVEGLKRDVQTVKEHRR